MPFLPDLQRELDRLQSTHALRAPVAVSGSSRVHITVEGEPLVSFSSNDYLGLACHPALQAAATEAARSHGFGASASRLVSGTFPEHLALEQALATLVATPSTLLFPTGYQANLAILTALAGPHDLIVADRAVHASLIDGCRLSSAKLALYPHLDLDRAAHHLGRLSSSARRRFLLTESVFSMDGDVAPLPDLESLAATHDAALIVDEAHAIGILGPAGGGLCRHFGVRPFALIGTLGKALGASGAFVAGSELLRQYLVNRARPFLFTTALPPPVAAAALAAIAVAISDQGDALRRRLASNISYLHQHLNLRPQDLPIPILPVLLGSDARAVAASQRLRQLGFLVTPIRPPTVRPGTARLRLTLTAAHRHKELHSLGAALASLPDTLSALPEHTNLRHPRPVPTPSFAGVVLVGTDTGVGKTTVAAGVLRLLARRGLRPVPFKPAETGCNPVPADALLLAQIASLPNLPLEHVCPFRFPLPVAPAADASHSLSLPLIMSAANTASLHGSHLVVELAGGLLTPYAPGLTGADIAKALGLPVVLVSRNGLGTINHTALAIAEIRRRSLPLLGLVLVHTSALNSPDQATNPEQIRALSGITPDATVPYLPVLDPDLIADALEPPSSATSWLVEPISPRSRPASEI